MKDRMQLFDYINYLFLFLIVLVTLYPFVNVVAVSLSSYAGYVNLPLRIWPDGFNLEAYKSIFAHPLLFSSYKNTIVITILTVIIGLTMYVLAAYPLSRKDFRGKSAIMTFMVFTMMFSGGLIPNFYLIKSLGLYDTLTAQIAVAVFTTYNCILVKNFFETIPDSLLEAARIDGASEFFILFKIVVPLSKAIIATICLFVAVDQWNSFFNAVVYVRSTKKWTLMLLLREIVIGSSIQDAVSGAGSDVKEDEKVDPVMFQYASLVVVLLPILCVYPFVQKYFVKGMLVGSVKE